MIEFKSIKYVALKLFYGYKMMGVITIPLITILFITSTTNLLTDGKATLGFDLGWAVIYAICFDMNGMRLIIDAAVACRTGLTKASIADYSIGIALVVLGTAATFIEGLVGAQLIQWTDVKGWIWLILALRSIAVIAMIIRECVHYAPLLVDNIQSSQTIVTQVSSQTSTPIVTNIVVNQTNQTAQVCKLATEQKQEVRTITELASEQTSELLENSEQTSELFKDSEQTSELLENSELLPNELYVTELPTEQISSRKEVILSLMRTEPNIKQKDIVTRTGYSKSYVSQVCKGVR